MKFKPHIPIVKEDRQCDDYYSFTWKPKVARTYKISHVVARGKICALEYTIHTFLTPEDVLCVHVTWVD